MKIIGVTGGVGAGKSEVLNYIGNHYDAAVVEADEAAHLLMSPGRSCYDQVAELMGERVIREDGSLDRKLIAEIVYSDTKKLEQLNAIVHPAVKKYILKSIEREQKIGTEYFFVEAALLIEDKYDEICDELWYIYAGEGTRRNRLKAERGYSDERITAIMAKQLSDDEFYAHCDFQIDNGGSFENTEKQIELRMSNYEAV